MPVNPTSPKMGLLLLLSAQSQPEVIVNQDLRVMEAMIGLTIVTRALTVPPGAPADGACYIPSNGSTGAWAAWDQMVAIYSNGGWIKVTPWPGLKAYVQADDNYIRWTAIGSPVGWIPST